MYIMYSRSTRRSKLNISRESYLQEDQTTSFEDPKFMMQSQQYPPTFTPNSKAASMLYSMLPHIVQSRLPRIPSIRKSVDIYGFVSGRKSESTLSGASTPGFLSSSSTMTLVNERSSISSDGETDSYFLDDSHSSDEDFPKLLKNGQLQTIGLSETKSGIGWKFANQGYSLLALSFEESSAISQNTRFSSTSLARQLYVHALTYLLRALPSDLSTEEKMSLQSAIPTKIVDSLQEESYTSENSQDSTTGEPPSLLQRSIAAFIIQLFILFQFVLPYLKHILSSAYQYDRTHKISEKVLSKGIVTVDTIGKSSLAVTGAVYGMSDGKVGQALTDAAAWIVEGVTGGVHEGVSEGLIMLGARNGTSPRKK
ncbi:uncharacterized protein EAE98_007547 [Botrytis deweyae]|uniref:Senescence domain-containing protein n=1 Tax=Botrytis deweyae TaxID=2478750 RepID=A0ABQ7IGK8_9HELO|nr:uncharacterized protein EAE98_007547 [Botrytis deweyae]KAF7923729.1 hypothetical protein EAE98_007547 [Botrytis deweyae]